jgi:nitric oxide reductase NorQ protein
LLEGEETVWHDGPLTTAVRSGAICYLDEVVEARKDTVVIIHPLTDDRRRLPMEKRGTVIEATPEFMLVVSYNPGYQSIIKDLKQSTRQRFVAMEFDYPPPKNRESRKKAVSTETAADLKIRLTVIRATASKRRDSDANAEAMIASAFTVELPRGRHLFADHRRRTGGASERSSSLTI